MQDKLRKFNYSTFIHSFIQKFI